MYVALSKWSRNTKSTQEFRLTLPYLEFFAPVHVMFCDKQNIEYQLTGRIPIRHDDHTGSFPVEWSKFRGWNGYLTSLPGLVNPESGYIVVAQNEIVPREHEHSAHFGQDWSPPYRAQEIYKQLSSSTFDIEDVEKIRNNKTSTVWSLIRSQLIRIKEAAPNTKNIQFLIDWNGNVYPEKEDSDQDHQYTLYLSFIKSISYSIDPLSTFPKWYLMGRILKTLSESDKDYITINILDNTISNNVTTKFFYFTQPVKEGYGRITSCICNRKCYGMRDEFTAQIRSRDPTCSLIAYSSSNDHLSVSLQQGQSGNMFSRHYDDWLEDWQDNVFKSTKSNNENNYKTLIIKKT
ncbi:hypothetical protein AKO1_011698 [Acrasis kona]|uniref:Uncharacterized protein n=1 Tax=Acrasis kona TaxID=1008807 RepID=A0AAW2Z7Q2_9EUKA